MVRLFRFLESLNPARCELNRSLLTLRAFRMSCLTAALLLPLFGVLHHTSGSPVADPWALRWGGVAVALAALALTYASRTVRHYTCPLHQSGIYGMTVYVGWLAHANRLAADYALSYLFVFAALALSHSLAYTSRGPFLRYLLVSTAIAMLVVVTTPRPGVWLPVFVVSVVLLAVILYISVVARVETYRALAVSQSQHAAAEALAGSGSWVLDVARGTVSWSAGARRLFGLAPDAALPPMTDFVHPEDRERAVGVKARLMREGGTSEITFRVIAADGTERMLRSVSHAEFGADGTVSSLYGVLYDVTAQIEREAALLAARDRAEAGARAKSDFLANMSHEIRTPLTAIIGFAQILHEESGETYSDLIEPIQAGGVRLLDTLNSVLDLARMDATRATLALTRVDVAAEVRGVVALLGSRAAAGVTLAADVEAGLPAVLADAPALSRVLANLVSNALKFTAAGDVRVSARVAADRVEIAVADTGAGMSPAFLETLYEPFRQASTGWSRTHEGTGLGLTITQRLVHAMGGTVAVESAPGCGTVFTVSLAAASAPEDDALALSVPDAGGPTARERAAA